jgi:hypothetical protein
LQKRALDARASVSMIRRDDNFQNEARLLATLEARGLSVSVTSPDAGLDGSALYQQLIEANRLKPVSKEKPCLWGVALEVANANGVRNLVVAAHRFFAGTDTFQYYEIVFNSRGEGECASQGSDTINMTWQEWKAFSNGRPCTRLSRSQAWWPVRACGWRRWSSRRW